MYRSATTGFSDEPLAALEAVERRIQGPGIDLEDVARVGLDHLRETEAVLRSAAQGLEDDEVEGALEELDAESAADSLPSPQPRPCPCTWPD